MAIAASGGVAGTGTGAAPPTSYIGRRLIPRKRPVVGTAFSQWLLAWMEPRGTGAQRLARALSARGADISPGSICKWLYSGFVPRRGDVILALAALTETPVEDVLRVINEAAPRAVILRTPIARSNPDAEAWDAYLAFLRDAGPGVLPGEVREAVLAHARLVRERGRDALGPAPSAPGAPTLPRVAAGGGAPPRPTPPRPERPAATSPRPVPTGPPNVPERARPRARRA